MVSHIRPVWAAYGSPKVRFEGLLAACQNWLSERATLAWSYQKLNGVGIGDLQFSLRGMGAASRRKKKLSFSLYLVMKNENEAHKDCRDDARGDRMASGDEGARVRAVALSHADWSCKPRVDDQKYDGL
jgi:hypothetical protein